MSKQVWVSFGIIITVAVAVTAVSLTDVKHAYGQSTTPQFAISSTTSMGTASTTWIVDPIARKVIFCRQLLPNGSGEQMIQFSCKSQPLP